MDCLPVVCWDFPYLERQITWKLFEFRGRTTTFRVAIPNIFSSFSLPVPSCCVSSLVMNSYKPLSAQGFNSPLGTRLNSYGVFHSFSVTAGNAAEKESGSNSLDTIHSHRVLAEATGNEYEVIRHRVLTTVSHFLESFALWSTVATTLGWKLPAVV